MKTLSSELVVPQHNSLGSAEMQVLQREFAGERKTTDDGYNTLARQMGNTTLDAKSYVQLKFVAMVNGAMCVLFELPPDRWGCYVFSKDAETCVIANSAFRNRLERAFGSPIADITTTYPSWERPKDLMQFLLVVASQAISALCAYLIPQYGKPSTWAAALILILLIPVAWLGRWSLRRK
jgi:hypothetical protein